jgi:hypothetical protein
MNTEGVMTRRKAADLAQNTGTPVSRQIEPHIGDGDLARSLGNPFAGARPKSSSLLNNNAPPPSSQHCGTDRDFHSLLIPQGEPQHNEHEYQACDMTQTDNRPPMPTNYGSHDHSYARNTPSRAQIHEPVMHRSRAPQREPRPRRFIDISPGSDSELEPHNGDPELRNIVYGGRPQVYANHRPKIPVFYGDGKETWIVWFNRFNDIANRHRWGNARKLDELLPCLQGTAGEFVYGQLPRSVRTDFPTLISELTNRFHRHETSKRFHAKFSNRSQKPHESVEEYAADLKRLYDKAHSARDPETRKEDLLRRFLDGLNDDHARFHVEFVKDPSNIDEAVYEVVNFIDTKKRSRAAENSDGRNRKVTRQSHTTHLESDSEAPESEDECDHTARVSDSKTHPNPFTNTRKPAESKPRDSSQLEEIKSMILEMTKGHTDLQNRMSKLELSLQKPYPSQNRSYQGSRNQNSHGNQSRECYACGQEGHFARECPLKQGHSFSREKAHSSTPSNGSSSPSGN